ncbi:transposable element Tcb2 transposase [Trichonephila clavipes]|nr:transposable element Tcb2 transposase [Trichonephila clavipes]
MQHHCALRIAGRERLTSFSVEYKKQGTALPEPYKGYLGSWRPLHVLPFTPTYRRRRLEWCHARRKSTAVEWNHIVFSDEFRFNLISEDNRVRVWRPHGERLNSIFALQRLTAPTASVMV